MRRPNKSSGSAEKRWINLNVGGTYFSTCSATLTRSIPPCSPLFRIANNSTNVDYDRDPTGAYLIDRDPAYFQVVLNYLRHGRLLLTRDTTEEGVLVEALYYILPDLESLIKQRIQATYCPWLVEQQPQQQPQPQPRPPPQQQQQQDAKHLHLQPLPSLSSQQQQQQQQQLLSQSLDHASAAALASPRPFVSGCASTHIWAKAIQPAALHDKGILSPEFATTLLKL